MHEQTQTGTETGCGQEREKTEDILRNEKLMNGLAVCVCVWWGLGGGGEGGRNNGK